MAILYTQGTWVFSEDHSAIVAIKDHKVKMVADFGKSDLPETEANAKLILNAVNNTAGKGIDPVAVPQILNALKKLHIVAHSICGIDAVKNIINNPGYGGKTLLEALDVALKAIKSAEIK